MQANDHGTAILKKSVLIGASPNGLVMVDVFGNVGAEVVYLSTRATIRCKDSRISVKVSQNTDIHIGNSGGRYSMLESYSP